MIAGKKSTRPVFPQRMPWWMSVLLAIVSYCCLKYLVPELQLQHPTLQKLSQAAPTFAPLVTIPFLLLAAKQLYDTDVTDEDHDTQEDSHEEKPEE
ncbi:MAG: hypothetical protein WBB19_15435 [Desulforhopalus sp.]